MDECIHGMNPDWCALCRNPCGGATGPGSRTPIGVGDTKQDELTILCDQLGIARVSIGVGSSVPSHVFDEVKARFGLRGRSMPEIAQTAALAAGLPWEDEFDSRGTLSGGGSTVTLAGLAQLNRAAAILIARDR